MYYVLTASIPQTSLYVQLTGQEWIKVVLTTVSLSENIIPNAALTPIESTQQSVHVFTEVLMNKENSTLDFIASLTTREAEALRRRFGIFNATDDTDDVDSSSELPPPSDDDENGSGGVPIAPNPHDS